MGTVGSLALSIGLVLVGGIIGLLIGRRARRPSARDRSVVTIAELLSRLIGSAKNGVVVLNRFGDVVIHNERAVDLGVVRAKVPDARARAAAERALIEDRTVTVDLSQPTNRGRAPRAVVAEARPLGDGFIVVDAVDESEAVRLESTRRDFVANVSHELKTPVGALALLAEAILDAAGEPEQVRRFSGKILHEATRLGTLVTELIALSRLQGAERLPELTALDVDDLVQEALGRCRLAAESAGIDVTTDEDMGLEVDGDRMLLVTALSNLIDNAISYSPEGSPVSVSRRLVAGHVEISVTDRGIGIDPELQQRVFERFFRVDQARSRATGGTGLGLAIVKHVAANHGGSVRLWSSPGTGSTFTLSVPAKAAPSHVPAEPGAAGAGTTGVEAAEVGSVAIGSVGERRSTAVQHEGVQ
ncbi:MULTISPECIES: sensor histidine kinase [Actinoalloteichus]|uniref:Sensor-like histidine kinase SenX3 n=1 Tax=Actinoalloteichus fjordicus TaxID=1612552 RepID=A0AAC9L8X9_9PSEU|nr:MULTISPECIES: ATP-binding protein [Actinoalloteichus]APU12534.1 histidine kinase [Actinoalloteichus fjordicus]APU18488.1 histidine kinase [Actinoalloteichus sp. GBA129-24]